MTLDVSIGPLVGVGAKTMEVELAQDIIRHHGGVREETRVRGLVILEEDATHRVRQELREQQPAAIDDGAPRLADAPRGGEATGRSLMVVSLLHKKQAPYNCFTLSLCDSNSCKSNSWRDDHVTTC